MTKRLLVSLIAFFVVFTTIGNASAAPLFKDVSDSFPTRAELAYLAERGIITADPTSNFGVNQEITRLEASEMIVKALGLSTDNRPAPNFKDISPGGKGYDAIATIADERIMGGNANGEFMPNAKLTRGQMAAILVSAFKLEG